MIENKSDDEIGSTRTVVSPDVAWLAGVATLSTEVVVVASASSVLVRRVRGAAWEKQSMSPSD